MMMMMKMMMMMMMMMMMKELDKGAAMEPLPQTAIHVPGVHHAARRPCLEDLSAPCSLSGSTCIPL